MTKAKGTPRTGRPSRFNESIAARILELAKSGATDQQIASNIGISPVTLHNWKGKHPDFLKALKAAKSVADDLVEASLFQRAIGYSQPAVKFFFNPKATDSEGKVVGKVISQAYVERLPPDVTACIFWLKNRRPDLWREKSELDLKGGADDETKPRIVVTLPSNGRELK